MVIQQVIKKKHKPNPDANKCHRARLLTGGDTNNIVWRCSNYRINGRIDPWHECVTKYVQIYRRQIDTNELRVIAT